MGRHQTHHSLYRDYESTLFLKRLVLVISCCLHVDNCDHQHVDNIGWKGKRRTSHDTGNKQK